MKLNKLALTLTAAALLPTFAYAATDTVAASFERDLQRSATVTSTLTAKAEADPLNIVNNILNKQTDVVVASFDRDLYRVPTTTQTVLFAGTTDPLDAINIAFRSGEPNTLLASFQRDLFRESGNFSVAIANEADPLVGAINVATWS